MVLLIDEKESFESLVGKMIGTYTVAADDVENALRPAFAYIDALLSQSGAEFYLERRVVFPGIVNTYGTADLIIRIGGTIYVIDLKFGAGVRVFALTPDGQDPTGIYRFAPFRRLAGAERERARPSSRAGRNRTIFRRGT